MEQDKYSTIKELKRRLRSDPTDPAHQNYVIAQGVLRWIKTTWMNSKLVAVFPSCLIPGVLQECHDDEGNTLIFQNVAIDPKQFLFSRN